ncbi:MAG: WXG100 family type VII secretion target [Clostridiales bacterium]|nr:WXG100 family type VII secretion target [Clostridiales bacterium]
MEGTLRVTPEQLEAASSEFAAKGTVVGNLTSQMVQLVDGLGSIWEGEAAAAYQTRFRQLDEDIQKMVQMIQEHSNDLNEMAKIYRDAETANSEMAADLAGDVIV